MTSYPKMDTKIDRWYKLPGLAQKPIVSTIKLDYQRRLSGKRLQQTVPLIEALKEIASAHGATPAQVALSWLVSFYGETVVAIPGTTTVHHAEQNAAALELMLTDKELARIDSLSGIMSPRLLLSFVILGLFPIAVKKLLSVYRSKSGRPEAS